MSRAAITNLPIRNALRRSYLNSLFLLRPIVSFSAPSRSLYLKASHLFSKLSRKPQQSSLGLFGGYLLRSRRSRQVGCLARLSSKSV